MIRFEKASKSDANLIHYFAHSIYYPTYTGILSTDQMDFMLEKSYSILALENTISVDQDFYLVFVNDKVAGFIATKLKSTAILRIEKLYLLPEVQGMGIGRACIQFANDMAKAKGCDVVELNVNRGNKAYQFYLSVGFIVSEVVDIPYYDYVLDDYVMQKQVV